MLSTITSCNKAGHTSPQESATSPGAAVACAPSARRANRFPLIKTNSLIGYVLCARHHDNHEVDNDDTDMACVLMGLRVLLWGKKKASSK